MTGMMSKVSLAAYERFSQPNALGTPGRAMTRCSKTDPMSTNTPEMSSSPSGSATITNSCLPLALTSIGPAGSAGPCLTMIGGRFSAGFVVFWTVILSLQPEPQTATKRTKLRLAHVDVSLLRMAALHGRSTRGIDGFVQPFRDAG